MDKRTLEKVRAISEEFFGTKDDPNQIPITAESHSKFLRLHPRSMIYKMEDGQPVCWVLVLPTTKKLASRFLVGEINERQLLDMTEPLAVYDALYLCSAFTVPAYRNKGYAALLLKDCVQGIPLTEDPMIFAWIFSEEGGRIVEKLGQELGRNIEIRKDS